MSTSVTACLFSTTGAARARTENSAGAATVESFMVEICVEGAKVGGMDNGGRVGQEGKDNNQLPGKTLYTSSNTPLHPSFGRPRKYSRPYS